MQVFHVKHMRSGRLKSDGENGRHFVSAQEADQSKAFLPTQNPVEDLPGLE